MAKIFIATISYIVASSALDDGKNSNLKRGIRIKSEKYANKLEIKKYGNKLKMKLCDHRTNG